jgi:REP-associated tyrosine transposase
MITSLFRPQMPTYPDVCDRHINGVYTQRFKKAHHIDGRLFRGRYESILIDPNNYLLELIRYIHRIPIGSS